MELITLRPTHQLFALKRFEPHSFLAMTFKYDVQQIETIITQKKYTERILQRFKMEDANPANTPMDLVMASYTGNEYCAT